MGFWGQWQKEHDPDPNPDPHTNVTDPEHWRIVQDVQTIRSELRVGVCRPAHPYISLKNDVNVPSKSNKQKNRKKHLYFVGILRLLTKRAGSGSESGSVYKCHGSGTLENCARRANNQIWTACRGVQASPGRLLVIVSIAAGHVAASG